MSSTKWARRLEKCCFVWQVSISAVTFRWLGSEQHESKEPSCLVSAVKAAAGCVMVCHILLPHFGPLSISWTSSSSITIQWWALWTAFGGPELSKKITVPTNQNFKHDLTGSSDEHILHSPRSTAPVFGEFINPREKVSLFPAVRYVFLHVYCCGYSALSMYECITVWCMVWLEVASLSFGLLCSL